MSWTTKKRARVSNDVDQLSVLLPDLQVAIMSFFSVNEIYSQLARVCKPLAKVSREPNSLSRLLSTNFYSMTCFSRSTPTEIRDQLRNITAPHWAPHSPDCGCCYAHAQDYPRLDWLSLEGDSAMMLIMSPTHQERMKALSWLTVREERSTTLNQFNHFIWIITRSSWPQITALVVQMEVNSILGRAFHHICVALEHNTTLDYIRFEIEGGMGVDLFSALKADAKVRAKWPRIDAEGFIRTVIELHRF